MPPIRNAPPPCHGRRPAPWKETLRVEQESGSSQPNRSRTQGLEGPGVAKARLVNHTAPAGATALPRSSILT